jgi:chemotaxis protein CheX
MADTATAPKSTIDVKLVTPFLNSVRSVFSTMVGMQITVERPSLKTDPNPAHDVSSIIGFSGQIVGSVTLSFETAVARKLVTAFAGSDMDPTSPDFADAVGELANMVSGAAKKDLGANANITVPSVVVGPGHLIAIHKDIPCVVIPCKSPAGSFTVEVNIKRVITL